MHISYGVTLFLPPAETPYMELWVSLCAVVYALSRTLTPLSPSICTEPQDERELSNLIARVTLNCNSSPNSSKDHEQVYT